MKVLEDVQEKKLSGVTKHRSLEAPCMTTYAIGKSKVGCTSGPDTVLTQEKEEELVGWAVKVADTGNGEIRRQICEAVQRILDHTKRPNPFTEK